MAWFANSPLVTAGASPLPLSSPPLDSYLSINPSAVNHPNPGYAQTTLSPIFTPEVQYWGNQILAWAAEFGLDPNLAATVMQIESCGFERATSRSGAIGLFQVMPFHFSAADASYHPDTNAQRGLAYLAGAVERAGGDPRLALAGYNGGIGLIGRDEWAWPAETKRYVYYGGAIYADAAAGMATSPTLDEWYLKYGVSLCGQAHNFLGLP